MPSDGPVFREHPRLALLRRMDDLNLASLLRHPNWHILCDAPMEAHFQSLGIPSSRMTQALEHGAFLSDGFALPCPPGTTILIATRRSEEAVIGVLKSRGIRAMPLFARLLPRLAANANLRQPDEALKALPIPKHCLAIVGHSWSGLSLAGQEVQRLTGTKPVHIPCRSLTAMAEHRGLSSFDPTRWWTMMMRANNRDDAIVMSLDGLSFQAFRHQLGPQERESLDKRFARLHVLRLKRDPLALAAAEEAVASAGVKVVDRDRAAVSILGRRNELFEADLDLDRWLQSVGVRTTEIDCADLCRDPTGSVRSAIVSAGLAADHGLESSPAAPLPCPIGQRFDRFLEAALAAQAAGG